MSLPFAPFAPFGRLAAVLSLTLAPLAALSDEPTAPARALTTLAGIVTDATGRPMGPFYPSIDMNLRAVSAVLVLLSGKPVLIPLIPAKKLTNPAGMVPTSNHVQVLYESPDCSGQGWLEVTRADAAGVTPAAILIPDPRKERLVAHVYLPGLEHPVRRVIRSAELNAPGTGLASCIRLKQKVSVRRVEQIIELPNLYETPFHLQ